MYSMIWSTLAMLSEWSSRKIWLALSRVDLLWKISSWLGNACSFQAIPMTSKLGFSFQGNYFTYWNFQAEDRLLLLQLRCVCGMVCREQWGLERGCLLSVCNRAGDAKQTLFFLGGWKACKTIILTMLLSAEVEFKDCSESNLKQLSRMAFQGGLYAKARRCHG